MLSTRLLLPLALALTMSPLSCAAAPLAKNPLPRDKWPVWPKRFNARLLQNRSGSLAEVEHYYDYTGGRSLLLIRSQLGTKGTLVDYEVSAPRSLCFPGPIAGI